ALFVEMRKAARIVLRVDTIEPDPFGGENVVGLVSGAGANDRKGGQWMSVVPNISFGARGIAGRNAETESVVGKLGGAVRAHVALKARREVPSIGTNRVLGYPSHGIIGSGAQLIGCIEGEVRGAARGLRRSGKRAIGGNRVSIGVELERDAIGRRG